VPVIFSLYLVITGGFRLLMSLFRAFFTHLFYSDLAVDDLEPSTEE
jgi:hypothetical protein